MDADRQFVEKLVNTGEYIKYIMIGSIILLTTIYFMLSIK